MRSEKTGRKQSNPKEVVPSGKRVQVQSAYHQEDAITPLKTFDQSDWYHQLAHGNYRHE